MLLKYNITFPNLSSLTFIEVLRILSKYEVRDFRLDSQDVVYYLHSRLDTQYRELGGYVRSRPTVWG